MVLSSFSVFGTDWKDVLKRVFENPAITTSSGSMYIGEKDGDDNVSGEGAILYSDGSSYWGDWSNNNYDGTGIYIIGDPDNYRIKNCPNCAYYVGEFENGVKSGYGTCYDVNGKLLYYGRFENDSPASTYPSDDEDLVRMYTWENREIEDGLRYVGEIKEGTIHGRGIFLVSKGAYAAWYGYFYEGEPWGEGIWFTNSGSYITGEFESVQLDNSSDEIVSQEIVDYILKVVRYPSFSESGVGKYLGNTSYSETAEGLGLYAFDGGDYVFGEFHNNARNGMCMYLISDPENYFVNCPGSRYFVGYYSENKREGTGTLYDADGKLLYYGNFSGGKPTDTYPSTGYDKYRFERIDYDGGDIYIGETENGQRQGRGIYIYAENNIGIWYSRYLNGKAYGKGVLLRFDGTIRNGEFLEDGTFVDAAPSSNSGGGTSIGGGSATVTAKTLYDDPLYDLAFEKMFAGGAKIFSSSNDKYKGMFDDEGYMTGLGCYKWNSGSVYWGYQNQNNCEDYGIYLVSEDYYLANCDKGAFYVGEYANDYRNGMGTVYDEYGTLLYYGEFEDGKPIDPYPSTEEYLKEWKFAVKDFGTYIYIGELHNGLREGRGFIVFKNNGDAWYGPWDEDHRSGIGVYIYANGSIDYGEWNTDDFTRYSY